MKLITDWKLVPNGMFMVRMFHARTDCHVLHLCVRVNDGPWSDQIHVPAHSEYVSKDYSKDFWDWAKANLPIYDYPEKVKAS